MMDFSPQPNQGRQGRGDKGRWEGKVPFADKSRPAYLNPAEACRVQSEASFALSFGLQAPVNRNRDATRMPLSCTMGLP